MHTNDDYWSPAPEPGAPLDPPPPPSFTGTGTPDDVPEPPPPPRITVTSTWTEVRIAPDVRAVVNGALDRLDAAADRLAGWLGARPG